MAEEAPTAEPGNVRLVNSSTDELTIEAEVKSPSILLITDTYAKGWRARALPGSSQASYHVMPGKLLLAGNSIGGRASSFAIGVCATRFSDWEMGFDDFSRYIFGLGGKTGKSPGVKTQRGGNFC